MSIVNREVVPVEPPKLRIQEQIIGLTSMPNSLNESDPSSPSANNGIDLYANPQPGTSKVSDSSFLYCDETIPPSLHSLSPIFCDFDSDDSVKDKDYEVTSNYVDSSEESDTDRNIKKTLAHKSQIKCISQRKGKRSSKAEKEKCVPSFPNKVISRRHSFNNGERAAVHDPVFKKRRASTDAAVIISMPPFDNPATSDNEGEEGSTARKRKKYNSSVKQREIQRKKQKLLKYTVKPGCDEKCIKKCSSVFDESERENINKTYWSLQRGEMRMFIRSNYIVAIPKRKYTSDPKRNPKRTFTLQKNDGTVRQVCKIFFLTTLGFNRNNDLILTTCLDTEKDTDKRGKHTKKPAFNRDLLNQHVESFNPSAPHYRREHAPNRRYLPNDININFMYKDFCSKNPESKLSYDLYRSHLKSMNISFTRLGNEECEQCESYKHHTKETSHDVRKQCFPDCDTCLAWAKHHDRYKKARALYDAHKAIKQNENSIYFSGDLEKVIMLPRMEMFKAVIFCPRLTLFNQSFAPVGKISKESKPLAAIWHDGIAGRKQEDIMSAYYSFFLRHRDVQNVNIWLDNCTSQNKNWLFYSMLVDLVNSDVISTETITLHYFEPGHTFMSCDQFHHQVELAMKKKGKIYDFSDFEEAVASANNGRVTVKALQANEFLNLPNNVSERRIQQACPRVYLKNITQVSFKRSSYDMLYKNDFSDEYSSFKFLNDKYLRNPRTNISFRTQPKGIDEERKSNLITKLSPIIPKHKMVFWNGLPTNNNTETTKNSRRTT